MHQLLNLLALLQRLHYCLGSIALIAVHLGQLLFDLGQSQGLSARSV